MGSVDHKTIANILRLSNALPERERKQLVALVNSWRKEGRCAPREAFHDLVAFKTANGVHYGHARDVSATGLFIETGEQFQVGEPVNLMLTMISSPNPIHLSGKIVRISGDGIAIHFHLQRSSQMKELESVVAKHALMMQPRR